MATTRQAGPGMGLSTWGMTGLNSQRAIQGGQTHLIPSGQYWLQPGPYCQVQALDPVSGLWRGMSIFGNGGQFVNSDGQNIRIANLTGCCVGALVTNVGSAYTSAPTVTTTGTAKFQAFVGGAISGTVTITNAGVGYNYVPMLVFAAPPAGGIQATGTCTLSGGVINAVTVVDQGAGYVGIPAITVIPDPREATQATPGPTTPAVLTAALLTTETVVTAVTCTDPGTGAYTAVPTLTFAGGGGTSAAATPIMCFAATGFTVGNAGVAYGNAQPFLVVTGGGIVPSPGTVVNPSVSNQLFIPRQANISGTTTSGSVITATGLVVNDAGLFQSVPNGFVLPSGTAALPTTTAIVTITVGAVTDHYTLQSF